MTSIPRRVLIGLAAAVAVRPRRLLAQPLGPIRIGTLTPQTGAGGLYGPVMVKAAKAVVDEVNAAGGVLGRPVELISEDDQTSPEAGVRAARKLIDVDKVSAILGTWASSVTTAVAPLCWESQTFLATVSGADSITHLPHQGYLVRTQPNTVLQGQKFGEFALSLGCKRIFFMSPQTPFTQSQFDSISAVVKPAGAETDILIYDDKKPSYRSEVDAALRFKADLIILGGYAPDTAVLLKDLFRADYAGEKLAFGYAVNQKLVESVGGEVADKVYMLSPSSALGSGAYDRLVKLIGVAAPDPYTCQIYDHINLVLLAIAQAGQASGTAIRDNIRKVSQTPGGVKVDNALDGLTAIKAGQAIDYDGASGPCDFTPIGDISDSKFRYEQVREGVVTLGEDRLMLGQALLNGIMSGALIALPAIGFTTIFAVLRYANFAVASYATIGAFAAWYANSQAGLGVVPALAVAFAVAGSAGVIAEEIGLRRLRPQGALTVAIASIGLNLILENLVRFFFGNDLRGYDLPLARDLRLWGLRIGPQQVKSLLLAVIIMAAVFAFLRFTRFGKAMRAVADNPDLARLKGIDPARVAVVAVFLGAGLSGAGGMLIGLDTSIDPLTGYRVLLSVFAAAVLGGLGSIPGAVAGALVLGIAEELALIVTPATYRSAIGFVAILVTLTFRPFGLFGQRTA